MFISDPILGVFGLNDEESKDRTMHAISSYLSNITKGKKAYIILDNPTGEEYSPMYFLDGIRLKNLHVNNEIPKKIKINHDQKLFIDKFTKLAVPASWTAINPWSVLCDDTMCSLLDDNFNFIYKDNNHLRSSWVSQHATYIDQTILQERHN